MPEFTQDFSPFEQAMMAEQLPTGLNHALNEAATNGATMMGDFTINIDGPTGSEKREVLVLVCPKKFEKRLKEFLDETTTAY